jgi:hypothetical protein
MYEVLGITRFELIDHREDAIEIGRAFVTPHPWNTPMNVRLDIQDDGQTVKVFLSTPND